MLAVFEKTINIPVCHNLVYELLPPEGISNSNGEINMIRVHCMHVQKCHNKAHYFVRLIYALKSKIFSCLEVQEFSYLATAQDTFHLSTGS
jgi:hypothetical protein